MDKSLILNKLKSHLQIESDKKFADFLGIKPNVLSNWHKRNTYDPELLYTKCEFVNASFLLTGEGPMLKNEANTIFMVNEVDNNYKTTKKNSIEEAIIDLVFEKLTPILESTDKKIAAIRSDIGKHNDFIMRTIQKEAEKEAKDKKKLG